MDFDKMKPKNRIPESEEYSSQIQYIDMAIGANKSGNKDQAFNMLATIVMEMLEEKQQNAQFKEKSERDAEEAYNSLTHWDLTGKDAPC